MHVSQWSVPGVVAAALLLTALPAEAQDEGSFAVELEAGSLWQSRNDAQIPNDRSGTRFSLVDLAGNGPWPAGRLYLTWDVDRRHRIQALAAPLSFTESGSPGQVIGFAGATYEPGVPVETTYRFNSWRVGYRYRITDREHLSLWIGFTAKIRDAEIELRQGDTSSKDTDVGFVPLLHVATDWRFADRWHLLADVDGLAGGPGRAFDVGAELAHDLSDRWRVGGGYRTVEGGADVESVYSFAWFHAFVMSAAYRF